MGALCIQTQLKSVFPTDDGHKLIPLLQRFCLANRLATIYFAPNKVDW